MELWRLSAEQLTTGFGTGAFSPVDALNACLERIAECEPVLNAFVHVDHAGARRAAEASATRWSQGAASSPLDGVPVSLKDNLNAAGLPTTWGSRLLREFVAASDEVPVARLRASGAVILGKTNLPEFAMQGSTTNLLSGTTRNPWDPSSTPGGSSGGAAASVAAGYSPLALCTDGGGSIRRPASHCGLVGFKPSAGIVARSGGLPEIFLDFEVVGGIGRTVADVALLMRALSADTNSSAFVTAAAASGRPPAPRDAQESKSRILFVPRFGTHPVDPGIAASARKAAERFAALGYRVTETSSFDLAEEINDRWSTLSCSGLAWLLGDGAGKRWRESGLTTAGVPDTMQCTAETEAALQRGVAMPAPELFDLFAAIARLERRLAAEVFADHDLILTPATAALPWPASASHPMRINGQPVGPRGHAVFTAIANAAGLPAIALPSGLVEGMPTGVQLVGRRREDDCLIAAALRFEAAYPWSTFPPGA